MTDDARPDTNHPADREDDSSTTEEKDQTLDRIVIGGRPRLHRSWFDLLATGSVAGIEVGIGVLALFVVEDVTGSRLLGALAFSIAFIALELGHSELFTEGFHVPVMVVAADEATVAQLLRLWGVTLVGNVLGGFVVAWLIATALPDLREVAAHSAREFTEAPFTLETFFLAVLAGAAITLLTRMRSGTDDDVAKVVAAVGIAFVIVGSGLFHSIIDTVIIFVAFHHGSDGVGLMDWLPWFGWAVLGNLLGGLLLTTTPRLVRSQQRLAQWREQ